MADYDYLPQDYEYEHELDPKDPNLLDPTIGPLLRAAFKVAEYAHTNPGGTPQLRHKLYPHRDGGPVKYISHPILVYRLLAAMGEKEPIVLAAALLHDALEDCEEFRKTPQIMNDMLAQELMNEGFDSYQAVVMSDMIVTICGQVKNEEARNIKMSKIKMQMKEVKLMGHEAKILKIADQTASIYDHLMEPDDPLYRPKEKAIDFAYKAHNLVRTIALHPTVVEDGKKRETTPGELRELARWDSLFKKIYEANRHLLAAKTPEQEEDAREGFRCMQPYLLHHIDKRDKPVKRKFKLDNVGITNADLDKTPGDAIAKNGMLEPVHCGINRVGLDRQGEVVRFTVWAAPEADPKHPRNQMMEAISKQFAAQRGVIVNVDDTQMHSVVLEAGRPGQKTVNEGQRFIFDNAMPVNHFLNTALGAGAITRQDKIEVLAKVKNLPGKSGGIASNQRNASGRGNALSR